MNEIEQAKELLKEMATDEISDYAQKLVDEGRARWELDPYVNGVVGLMLTDNPSQAVVIVYVNDRDFECDLHFEMAALGH